MLLVLGCSKPTANLPTSLVIYRRWLLTPSHAHLLKEVFEVRTLWRFKETLHLATPGAAARAAIEVVLPHELVIGIALCEHQFIRSHSILVHDGVYGKSRAWPGFFCSSPDSHAEQWRYVLWNAQEFLYRAKVISNAADVAGSPSE